MKKLALNITTIVLGFVVALAFLVLPILDVELALNVWDLLASGLHDPLLIVTFIAFIVAAITALGLVALAVLELVKVKMPEKLLKTLKIVLGIAVAVLALFAFAYLFIALETFELFTFWLYLAVIAAIALCPIALLNK